MSENRLRRLREAAGLTQAELARMAGVSRQLVGSVEAGRHLPRVDSAMAMAGVLGVGIGELFGTTNATPVDILEGVEPAEGQLLRAALVRDKIVTSACRAGPAGYDPVDAVFEAGRLEHLSPKASGFVVAGCEPGLELLERLLREGGIAAIAAQTSSDGALAALDAGRAHAAVIHGQSDALDERVGGREILRVHLARWRVGLAAGAGAARDWRELALSGGVPVIQREAGAGSQRAFDAARVGDRAVPGPIAGGHVEAAFRAVWSGMPAVTIEPAAIAAGAEFHQLETHDAELWVDSDLAHDRGVSMAMETIGGRRFRDRLGAAGGYDLSDAGKRVA